MRWRAFGAVLIGGVLLLGILQRPPDGDPFDVAAGRALALDRLPASDIVAIKLRHALAHPPYEIGLFGNSRSVEVTSAHLGLAPGRFFNFSVGGMSIRQSIASLEELAAADKAPRVALISFDNAITQFYANPDYPAGPARWRLAVHDIYAGARDPAVSRSEWLRMGWRHTVTEWNQFKQLFSIQVLRARLRPDGPTTYERDGARPGGVAPAAAPALLSPQPPSVLAGYIKIDLARLAVLQARGIRIVIYESPIYPAQRQLEASASDGAARAVRTALLQNCRALGLTCHLAPAIGEPGKPPFWSEASHPPPGPLGAWLRQRLVEIGAADR